MSLGNRAGPDGALYVLVPDFGQMIWLGSRSASRISARTTRRLRLELRTVASSWFVTTTIRVAISSASRTAGSDRGTSRTTYRKWWAANSRTERTRRTSSGATIARSDEASRLTPAFVFRDQPLKKHLVEPMRILECVDDREARLLTQEHGGVAV